MSDTPRPAGTLREWKWEKNQDPFEDNVKWHIDQIVIVRKSED